MPLRTFTDNQSPCFLSKYICFLLKEGRAQWNPKKNMLIFFIFFFSDLSQLKGYYGFPVYSPFKRFICFTSQFYYENKKRTKEI